MRIENLATTELQALANARVNDLTKKINAESWSDNIELLMKKWGEEAAGLRFMHYHSGTKWKQFSDRLAIALIIVSGCASTISLLATGIEDKDIKNHILFSVGGITLISTLIQSFKKFYNAEEKAANHRLVSKQFGSFYRYMSLQLSMSREDRDPADVLTGWALKEYERLQLESPHLSRKSIDLFKKTFKDPEQAMPHVTKDKFLITIYKKTEKCNTIKKNNITIDISLNSFNNNINDDISSNIQTNLVIL